jgi:hypothetical protein
MIFKRRLKPATTNFFRILKKLVESHNEKIYAVPNHWLNMLITAALSARYRYGTAGFSLRVISC